MGKRGGYGKFKYQRHKNYYIDRASKALAIAQAVRAMVNVEYKVHGTTITADPNTSGATQNLTAVGQGDDYNTRDGRKIRVKSCWIKGVVTLHASATNSKVRIVVAQDKSGTTALPTASSLFEDIAAMYNNKHHLTDPQTNSRFRVLWDEFVMLNTENPNWELDFYKELDDHVYFSGTGATDEGRNHIYCFIASSEATNDPVVTASAQVRFIDN